MPVLPECLLVVRVYARIASATTYRSARFWDCIPGRDIFDREPPPTARQEADGGQQYPSVALVGADATRKPPGVRAAVLVADVQMISMDVPVDTRYEPLFAPKPEVSLFWLHHAKCNRATITLSKTSRHT